MRQTDGRTDCRMLKAGGIGLITMALWHKICDQGWRVRLLAEARLCNDSGQVVHTLVPLPPNSIM